MQVVCSPVFVVGVKMVDLQFGCILRWIAPRKRYAAVAGFITEVYHKRNIETATALRIALFTTPVNFVR